MAKHVVETCYPEAYGLGGLEDIRWGAFRKTKESLRRSSFDLLMQQFIAYGLPFKARKDLMTFETPSGCEIWCMGLDDPMKQVRSVEFNKIWVEEATETNSQDTMHLDISCRRHNSNDGDINQLFWTLNPVDEFHHLKTDMIDQPDEDLWVMWSTWLDNPFLDEIWIRRLLKRAMQNWMFFRIYGLGQWGRLEHKAFHNYEITSKWPDAFDYVIWGIDFGWTNPTAVAEIGFLDGQPWIRGRLYQSHMTNSELIDWMKRHVPREDRIYCDNEEDRIREMVLAGFMAEAADKGPGCVERHIRYLQEYFMHFHPEDIEMVKEIRSHVRQTDREGRPIEGKYIDFWNHFIAAIRYAVWTHHHQVEQAVK